MIIVQLFLALLNATIFCYMLQVGPASDLKRRRGIAWFNLGAAAFNLVLVIIKIKISW